MVGASLYILFRSTRNRIAVRLRRLREPRYIFGAMVPAFLFNTPGTISVAAMFLRAIALWIIFVTVRVYFAGVTMARARLGSADPRARRAAWMPLAGTVAALGVVAVPLVHVTRTF